jgi:hypothetical protein
MWRSIKRSKPEIGLRVKVKHWVTGAGAPEADGWESVGTLRPDGNWSILQNDAKTVDYRPVTHWDYI